MDEEYQDPANAILSEFGARLNDTEERQRLIKDRILLVGQNLIETKEEVDRQDLENKKKLNEMASEIVSIKGILEKIINEMAGLGRKSEIDILERQMKLFDPLALPDIKEIRKIIKEEVKSIK